MHKRVKMIRLVSIILILYVDADIKTETMVYNLLFIKQLETECLCKSGTIIAILLVITK